MELDPLERQVEEYYDYSTSRFLLLGENAATQNLHRCVWAPEVRDRAEAADYANRLVWERLERAGAPPGGARVLDLGCGAGGGLAWLGARMAPGALLGVTVSRAQAERARRGLAPLSERHQVRIEHASFHALPDDLGPVDLAYAIEAFVHSGDPGRFFSEAARALRPGGLLVIVDDLLADRALSPQERGWLADFRAGWVAPSVLTEAQLLAAAPGFTLTSSLDLTGWLTLGRPRDRLIRLLVGAAPRWLEGTPWRRSLKGGDALQRLLASGAVQYCCLTLRRS
jgi:cyclopropane fatty-acyl-phospholipid synthase-like methyltransferase